MKSEFLVARSRVLRRLRLNALSALEPAEPIRRYERENPGELIHLDSGRGTANGRVAGRLTHHGADNVSDGLGVDPALLQNLARQPFNPLSDRLVFGPGRRGVSRRCGRLGHVILHWLVVANSLAGFAVGKQEEGHRIFSAQGRGRFDARSRSSLRDVAATSMQIHTGQSEALASGGAGPTFTRGISIGPVPVSGPVRESRGLS